MDKVTLKELMLYKLKDSTYHALRAVYEVENEFEKKEIIIPKIILPFYKSGPQFEDRWYGREEGIKPFAKHYVDLGFGMMEMGCGTGHDGQNNICYSEKILEEKTHTMTLSEIEKKLGYRINLVSEKEEE